MAITVTNESSFKRELIEAGTYFARCFQLIDLGTQRGEYQGKEIVSKKLLIAFELPTEIKKFQDKEGKDIEAPFVLSKEFTQSLGEKSKLLPFLQSWRGQNFTPEELKKFNVSTLLGAPCMIGVSVGTSKKGNQFNEITGITRVMKGFQIIPPFNEKVEFSLFNEDGTINFDAALFDKLPNFIQEKIKVSDEYKSLNWVKNDSVTNGPVTEIKDETDDLPF